MWLPIVGLEPTTYVLWEGRPNDMVRKFSFSLILILIHSLLIFHLSRKAFASTFVKRVRKAGSELMSKVPSRVSNSTP